MDILQCRGTPQSARRPKPFAEAGTTRAATLGLECLYERAGDGFVRVPLHRRQQGTACEWHERRVNGRLEHVSFTCETAEDWSALAAREPSRVPALYREILGETGDGARIRAEDLFWQSDVFARDGAGRFVLAFSAGTYNALNPWNTVRGAVHRTGSGGRPSGMTAVLWPAALRLFRPDGLEVSAALVRVTRRDPRSGAALRVSVGTPPGQHAAEGPAGLDALRLADGGPATPSRMARLLLPCVGTSDDRDSGDQGWDTGIWDGFGTEPAGAGSMGPVPARPTLPGPVIAAAMARAAAARARLAG